MRKNHIIILVLLCISLILIKRNIYPKSNELLLGDTNTKLGDVNSDGKINSIDYILVKSHILKKSKLTNSQIKLADMNNDNKINSLDYLLIKKIILGGTKTQTVTNNGDIEAYFLNTITNKNFKQQYTSNDSFIFRTTTGKYILLDTGLKSSEIKNLIYNKLKELQGKSVVNIDYMVISHMHSDHTGNAVDIINDSKFSIKNLILKSEKISTTDENIISAAKSKSIKIIDTNTLKDGSYYTLADNIKMYLFNVKDVYSNNSCSGEGYTMLFTSWATDKTATYAKTTDGKYFYFNGSDYIKNGNKAKIYTTNKLENVIDDSNPINSRFYAVLGTKRNQCSSNANSIAIVFQINTSKGNKYMYIPSDLENNGYNMFGEYDSNYKTTIHGFVFTYFYDYKMVDGTPRFIVKNNSLVKNSSVSTVNKAQEYITAKNVKSKFSDINNNIVVYQLSHHSLNNSKEAISLLNINKSSVYGITPSKELKNAHAFHIVETKYLLSNIKTIATGINNKNGVKCVINKSGTTTCASY